ncbi:MAG: carbohydrate-binding protein, partial [Paludibacteraceae bacterium]|nr:carbohydrate-binding protein [Paludibacteraceae bacterium]
SVETKAGEVYQFDANLKLTNKPFDPIVIPARIEAEEYTSMSGVQIEPDVNGIPNLGWINDGDWSKYLIDAPVAGKYIIRANVASEAEEPSQISVLDSAGALLGTLTVDPEKTDGWNDWYEAESSVTLPRGVQELTLRYSGESAFLMNIDWFELEPMDNNSVADIQSAASEIKLLSIVDGRVDLLITPQTDDTYTVYLYGVDGKTLSTFSGKGMKHLRFGDYSPLPTGIYNIVVEKDKDQQQLKILVKD